MAGRAGHIQPAPDGPRQHPQVPRGGAARGEPPDGVLADVRISRAWLPLRLPQVQRRHVGGALQDRDLNGQGADSPPRRDCSGHHQVPPLSVNDDPLFLQWFGLNQFSDGCVKHETDWKDKLTLIGGSEYPGSS